MGKRLQDRVATLPKAQRFHGKGLLDLFWLAPRFPAAHAPSVINWDGLLFDDWWPWEDRPIGAVEGWLWSS